MGEAGADAVRAAHAPAAVARRLADLYDELGGGRPATGR
jgi:hypothetical protein